MGSSRIRISRESRLLLLTVIVCAAVLLLMARVRFPESTPTDEPVPEPAPLERLAARATYDSLAADVHRVEPLIAPNLIVLRIRPASSAARNLSDTLASADAALVRHVAALRVSDDVAIAAMDGGERIDGIVGATDKATAAILAVDPVRRLARIRVPSVPVRQITQLPLSALPTPLYVVVVEGTQAGITLRPVFLGRGDRFGSPRWGRPLLPLGGMAVSPGALLFSLSGEFIGTVVVDSGAPAIAGARDVLEAGERMAGDLPATLADPGFTVQSLTATLRAALAVDRGVIVTAVEPGGAADGELEPADVIVGVGDWSTDSPDELLLRLASMGVGESVSIALIRDGEPRTVNVVLGETRMPAAAGASVTLVAERGVGTRVESSSGLADVDLELGDIIVRAGKSVAPGIPQVRRYLAQTTPSGFAVVVVRREGRQRVVAMPTGTDVVAR